MITLKPYQKEPVRRAIEYFRQENAEPSLIVMPTAAGKSIIAASVAAACTEPLLVVQPTRELLAQNLDKYRQLCGEMAPAGVYSASLGKKEIDSVTFATIGSIYKLGEKFKAIGFTKMLIDEAHLYPRKESSMLGQFLKESGIRQVLGITATPLKLEQFSEKQGKSFDKWSTLTMLTNPSPNGTFFKRILHINQISEMTAGGYWTPLKYEVIPYERKYLTLNAAGNEYTENSTVTAYQANNIRNNIIAALDYHKERKHVMVFVPSVDEAVLLSAKYPGSAALSGETPMKERAQTVKMFKEGKIMVLFNVALFLTGFDCPEIDMIVLAAPTASVARYYQAAGRGVRTAEGKNDCIIADMAGLYERFGLIEDIVFEYDGRWRMYGTGSALLSGIPIDCLGTVDKKDVEATRGHGLKDMAMPMGKHKGRPIAELPQSYMTWYMNNGGEATLRHAMLEAMESRVRDTRSEAPLTVLPDGQYAGKEIWTVPRPYLKWYYGSKIWNETNDNLRRGIEMHLR